MIAPSMARRAHPLASAQAQKSLLEGLPLASTFEAKVAEAGHIPLRTASVQILQMNLGKQCNQTCRHCHVDAGPDRKEVMPDAVVDACLQLLERSTIPVLDITGGAPEMHPRFRMLVERARALGRRVMDRCNLTIATTTPHADLPEFLATHQVEVIASLPHTAGKQTDAQRGEGVFEKSLTTLRRLNALGYGEQGGPLVLNLVTNPVGAFLPGNQASLEREWKRELLRRYGVKFNHLYTITNMPISRYLEFLVESGNLEQYMERLVNAFNPAAVDGLMCRTTLSVGWDGKLYDCDFNQMLEMPIEPTVFDVTAASLEGRAIRVGAHCFGCTAGAGSSCGGATVG